MKHILKCFETGNKYCKKAVQNHNNKELLPVLHHQANGGRGGGGAQTSHNSWPSWSCGKCFLSSQKAVSFLNLLIICYSSTTLHLLATAIL
ncbi:hypothetical protein MUK42_26984 [Musa troglodytarum]|uniref:Uncharacterized protein n=1 Tax=Musa troglodytarum TaxID=320322 RepID=A0A9E7F873_9LILI|nr:hypothetical protein MUK42_26984 [Musa troglodytarum]